MAPPLSALSPTQIGLGNHKSTLRRSSQHSVGLMRAHARGSLTTRPGALHAAALAQPRCSSHLCSAEDHARLERAYPRVSYSR